MNRKELLSERRRIWKELKRGILIWCKDCGEFHEMTAYREAGSNHCLHDKHKHGPLIVLPYDKIFPAGGEVPKTQKGKAKRNEPLRRKAPAACANRPSIQAQRGDSRKPQIVKASGLGHPCEIKGIPKPSGAREGKIKRR